MKQILFFSALCYSLVMASCGGGATEKSSDEPTAVQPVQQDSLQASSDSLKVDGTTGATQVANAPSFNGILMIPPQQHATITLSMGGAVHSVSFLPGDYVRKNQVILTLELEIKAPLNGYVTNMNVNVGKYFNVGEPVCDVIDKQAPMLQLTAYEKDLDKLNVGDRMEFHVNGMGNETFEAVLVSIDQMVDNANRSIKVYARVAHPQKDFRPGMYVSARKSAKNE